MFMLTWATTLQDFKVKFSQSKFLGCSSLVGAHYSQERHEQCGLKTLHRDKRLDCVLIVVLTVGLQWPSPTTRNLLINFLYHICLEQAPYILYYACMELIPKFFAGCGTRSKAFKCVFLTDYEFSVLQYVCGYVPCIPGISVWHIAIQQLSPGQDSALKNTVVCKEKSFPFLLAFP